MIIGELAAYVCSWLNTNGIKCVLTGGACVSIYTGNKYLSYDLDFIDITYASRKEVKKILKKLGFSEKNRYFVHPETKYFIEFPAGPLSVGSEPIKDYLELKFNTGNLFLLSPTDSVKDRLAAYYHWNDLQALGQAIMVARSRKTDLNEIRRWSKTEGQFEKFNKIKCKLQAGKSKSGFSHNKS